MVSFGFGFALPSLRGGSSVYGAEVQAYITRVQAQSGSLLPGVASGLDNLVTTLKSDGVWTGITDLHIACGVSNVAGACVKLVSSNVSYSMTATNYAITTYQTAYVPTGIDAGLNDYSNARYNTLQLAPPAPRTLVAPQVNLPSVVSWGVFGGSALDNYIQAQGGGLNVYNEIATTQKAQAYTNFSGGDYVQTVSTLGGGDIIVARLAGSISVQVNDSAVATQSGAQAAALGLRVLNISKTTAAWFMTQGLSLAQTQTIRNRIRAFLQSSAIGRTYGVNTFNYYGDSLTAGDNYSGQIVWPNQLDNSTTYPNWIGRKINYAASGTLAQILTTANVYNSTINTQAPSLYQTKVIGIVFYGTNDLGGGAIASTVLGYLRDIWARIRAIGGKAVASTIPPRDDTNWSPAKDLERVALNNLIIADSVNYDGLVDISAIPQLSDPNNTTYYLADKLHFTTAGHTAIANYVYATINPNTI